MDAFSSKPEDVLQRTVDVAVEKKRSLQDIENFLELDRCITFVTQNNFKKARRRSINFRFFSPAQSHPCVALQFPDELLWCSARVVSFLSQNTSARYFILGDTSYGSCCVDEIAAQHADADSIIHFGRSCLSPTTRLPVLHIYGRQPVDVEDLIKSFRELFSQSEQHVIVLYDVIYAHISDELEKRLQSTDNSVLVSKIPHRESFRKESGITDQTDESAPSPIHHTEEKENVTTHTVSGREFSLPTDHDVENFSIFYIGAESLTLKNLMMSLNKCPFYTYDPETRTNRRETLNVNKLLMKRYYMIERAKDAGIVGILVGTLGVAKYLDIVGHLKTIMKKAGKKYYTFAVGKLNVAKLANFMEVQAYVLVACQENTLIDSKEFYQPVVTPFEMEIACNQAREWTGDYTTDFHDILPVTRLAVKIEVSK
ncbi:putative diphthamide biosynthesis protein 2-like [Apostichopus japonicus]|uniref:2-(3-amino-3-carboxypropyl)histidine synthase subunit 2 n=1 Tax=Stichopus japonicus TaxID=307972 RepID=A0A2G8K3X8_STIJA|nr:putative diphthamide biosynthesis protein 2-like [Apostichopus japonicus]